MVEVPQMRKALSQIKSYDFGAEAFIPSLYEKITEINPDAYIMNGYGPTETTISCTMQVVTGTENITIGRPNANVFVHIVDENNREVPRGTLGELLISGKGVGRGYVNLPEKTAEAFINFNGTRAYKSGDLALINENGLTTTALNDLPLYLLLVVCLLICAFSLSRRAPQPVRLQPP